MTHNELHYYVGSYHAALERAERLEQELGNALWALDSAASAMLHKVDSILSGDEKLTPEDESIWAAYENAISEGDHKLAANLLVKFIEGRKEADV